MPVIGKTEREVTETDIKDEIRKSLASCSEIRVFRNNVGMLRDEYGTRVRYGLGVGSADLVGSVTIARGLAVPLAVEVKRPGERASSEQLAWLIDKRHAGWIACIATCPKGAWLAISAYCHNSPAYSASQVPDLAARLSRLEDEAG